MTTMQIAAGLVAVALFVYLLASPRRSRPIS